MIIGDNHITNNAVTIYSACANAKDIFTATFLDIESSKEVKWGNQTNVHQIFLDASHEIGMKENLYDKGFFCF